MDLGLLCIRSDQVPPDKREPSVRTVERSTSLRISTVAAREHRGGPHIWGVAPMPCLPPAILPSDKGGEISTSASPSHNLRRSSCILISVLWSWFIIDETFPTEVDAQYYTSPKSSNLLFDGYFFVTSILLGFNYFVCDNKAHRVLLIKWGKCQFPHCFLVKYIKWNLPLTLEWFLCL